MELPLAKLIFRRLKQGTQVFTSPSLISPSGVSQSTLSRYQQNSEVDYYKKMATHGLEDIELNLVNNLLSFSSRPATALVIGCGVGREAFALEKLGLKVTGIDMAVKMITTARDMAHDLSSQCVFIKASVFDLKDQNFDLIFISPAINGHIATRRERVRFYRKLFNLCHPDGSLISIPEIKSLEVKSPYYWASQALRLRHIVDNEWEPGDTAKSFLGNHSSDDQMLFYHYYPNMNSFHDEMKVSGFIPRDSSVDYLFRLQSINAFKPKIVHVAKYFPPESHGGMESLLYDLTSGLSQRGFEMESIVTTSNNMEPSSEIVSGVEVHRCKSFGSFASTPLSISYLQTLHRLKSDLVHLHLPNPLAATVGIQSETPLVVSYHCDVVSHPKLFSFYRPLMEKQLSRAQKIIVSSPQLIESSAVLAKFESKCQVIPFGIDRSFFKIQPQAQSELRELKNIYGKKMLLFVGRLVEYKGLEYLIRAMSEIDALLVIVGTGPEMYRLRRLVDELGLFEKVHFMGEVPRSDLGAYYKESDALVLPSIDSREAFGICLIEALAFGKPLVTTNIGTGVDFVNVDGQTGFCVPTKNPEALAFRLNEILTNQTLAEKLSANGLKRFEILFQLNTMLKSYLKLYEEVLGYKIPKGF